MQSRRDVLIEKAAGFGVPLPREAADAMLAYLDRLLEVNRAINLTAVRDPDEAVERHLADSLALGLHVREAGPPRRLLDLGTGGGFPGVPIALAWPQTEVHLADSTRKKVEAVRSIVEELGMPNVRCHWFRAGQADPAGAGAPPPAVDLVAARAVGALDALLSHSHAMLAPGGSLVAWKSEVPAEERAAAKVAAARLRMESLPDLEYQLRGARRLVRFRRAD